MMQTKKLGNLTMTGENVTWQDVFNEWVKSQVASLMGPDNQPPTEQEIKSVIMSQFKEMRKALMSEYDWMFLEDSPASAAAKQRVAAFRQALRDIPQNYPDIRDAIFPSPD